MSDVIKNDQLRGLVGEELYEKFGLFVSALRAELDMDEFSDCDGPEDVICFDDDYCFPSSWTRRDGGVVLHFNEHVGGNMCGEYIFIDGLWIDVEGEHCWNSETGQFSDGWPEWFVLDEEEQS